MVLSMMKLFIPAERRASAVEMLNIVHQRLGICADYLGSCIEERDVPCSHILYLERWKSKDALRDHVRSSLYRSVLWAIELSERPPEISFYCLWHSQGMDLIRAFRDGALKAAETK
jgi:hypothetical protein